MTKIAELVQYMGVYTDKIVKDKIKDALVGVFNTVSNCLIVNLIY